MPAHSRGNLSVEASFAHLLTAIVRAAGGEFRIKGSVVDMSNEPAALIREWDADKQEVVLRCGMGSFVEIYRVIPERQPGPQTAIPAAQPAMPAEVVDPMSKLFRDASQPDAPKPKVGSTLDDPEKLVKLEIDLRKRRVARLMADEIAATRRATVQQERTTP